MWPLAGGCFDFAYSGWAAYLWLGKNPAMKQLVRLSFLSIALALSACSRPEPVAERCKRADQVVFSGHFTTHNVDTAFQLPADIAILQTLFQGNRITLANACVSDAALTFWAGHDTLGHLSLVMDEACPQFAYRDGDSMVVIGLGAQPAVAFLRGIVASKAPRSAIEGLSFMLGQWTQTEPDGAYSLESWEQAGSSRLAGRAFTLMGKDTVFQERMSLDSEGKDLFLIVTANPQEGPVRFKMTSLKDRHATFENKTHDYPQMIEYKAIADSGLNARISGVRNGQYGAKDFPLKKVR
jgi:Domain of unknown function (DUF6265)